MANDVWRSDAEAQQFLNTTYPRLDEKAPADIVESRIGAIRVKVLLDAIVKGDTFVMTRPLSPEGR